MNVPFKKNEHGRYVVACDLCGNEENIMDATEVYYIEGGMIHCLSCQSEQRTGWFESEVSRLGRHFVKIVDINPLFPEAVVDPTAIGLGDASEENKFPADNFAQ